jgi:DNA-binding NarL/FixJ family response regulator
MQSLRFFAERVLEANGELDADRHWRAFVGGGWRVIDQFDSGGRRYVIARRSVSPTVLEPAEHELLTRRARGDGLKQIANDLGLSVSAVSRRVSSAMRKLGLRSHAELPAVFGGSDA